MLLALRVALACSVPRVEYAAGFDAEFAASFRERRPVCAGGETPFSVLWCEVPDVS